jgi:hypothetical protein
MNGSEPHEIGRERRILRSDGQKAGGVAAEEEAAPAFPKERPARPA